ncbi:MAG: LGFP repeat-containing protein [Mycobacteriaceae bacterium]|uniref:LGFP repeat-containing protein n=1 Tax=Corynebacterium sp. TaxID=1720 RepID=UPI003F97F567
MLKRSAAAIAAGGLLLGAAACSDDDSDSADTTAPAASGAAGASDDAAAGGADASDGADASGAADASEGADAGGAEGSDTELSEGLQAAYDEAGGETGELGAVQGVETGDDGSSLATFDNGWLVESADGGVVPLIGEIGNTWNSEGGLENEVGLPTSPETGDPATGWEQTFENGTIAWVNDGAGNWDADVQPAAE